MDETQSFCYFDEQVLSLYKADSTFLNKNFYRKKEITYNIPFEERVDVHNLEISLPNFDLEKCLFLKDFVKLEDLKDLFSSLVKFPLISKHFVYIFQYLIRMFLQKIPFNQYILAENFTFFSLFEIFEPDVTPTNF